MTPAGIEPATFRFVAQHLNRCATAVPFLKCRVGIFKFTTASSLSIESRLALYSKQESDSYGLRRKGLSCNSRGRQAHKFQILLPELISVNIKEAKNNYKSEKHNSQSVKDHSDSTRADIPNIIEFRSPELLTAQHSNNSEYKHRGNMYSQGCTNPEATKFSTVVPNMFGSSARTVLRGARIL